MITLKPETLTSGEFAPFGDVIQIEGATHYPINEGTTERFHDLARVDVNAKDGRPLINIFRGQPRDLPMPIRIMERHPLGSQAFIPLSARPYLVVVAPPGDPPVPDDLRAFIAAPGQGVNYRRGVWHHPLIALDAESDFVVIDRGGSGENCDEHRFGDDQMVTLVR